jgi:hypothetical protein
MRLQLVDGRGARPARPLGEARWVPAARWVRCAHSWLVALGLCWSSALPVHAQEATGTWSGAIEGRANYFWERSTRVIVPAVKAKVIAPNGFRVSADYLIDAITSASIAQTGSSEDVLFTEFRHGFGLEVGKEFDFQTSQLDLSIHGTYSTEDDYKSLIIGARPILILNEKNTRLRVGLSAMQDTILSNANPAFEDNLFGLMTNVGIEQTIDDRMVVSAGYQFGYLDGFLSNAYRLAPTANVPLTPEANPSRRFRHTVAGRFTVFIPSTDTAIHLLVSGYADTWDVLAITPELRIYQQIGPDFLIRPRYRFYAQTNAWFQLPPPYPADWEGPVTNDPKLTEYTTHTFGISLDYRLAFLAGSFLDFARNSWIEIAFDRYLNTNAYGNGIIGTAGGRLEF